MTRRKGFVSREPTVKYSPKKRKEPNAASRNNENRTAAVGSARSQ
jgi:hypothetical protein